MNCKLLLNMAGVAVTITRHNSKHNQENGEII